MCIIDNNEGVSIWNGEIASIMYKHQVSFRNRILVNLFNKTWYIYKTICDTELHRIRHFMGYQL